MTNENEDPEETTALEPAVDLPELQSRGGSRHPEVGIVYTEGEWQGLGLWATDFRVDAGKRKMRMLYEYTTDDGRIIDLEEDDISIDRREDRNRLANAALKAAAGSPIGDHTQAELHAIIRAFRTVVWKGQQERFAAQFIEGNQEPSEPSWLIRDYVMHDAGTIVFSPPGAGKSTLGLAWCQSIMHSVEEPYGAVEGMPLYVNLERDAASMSRRIGRINMALGLDPEAECLLINAKGRTLSEVYPAVISAIDEYGVNVTFLDSLSRAGVGSLVKDEDANAGMDLLNGLGTAWVALGHTPRGDSTHVYGSQMFTAAADVEVGLFAKEFRPGVTSVALDIAKANDVRKPPPAGWEWVYDMQGIASMDRMRHTPSMEAFKVEEEG